MSEPARRPGLVLGLLAIGCFALTLVIAWLGRIRAAEIMAELRADPSTSFGIFRWLAAVSQYTVCGILTTTLGLFLGGAAWARAAEDPDHGAVHLAMTGLFVNLLPVLLLVGGLLL